MAQGWSPRERSWPQRRLRGHILKFLALTSKPQDLENCLVALSSARGQHYFRKR